MKQKLSRLVQLPRAQASCQWSLRLMCQALEAPQHPQQHRLSATHDGGENCVSTAKLHHTCLLRLKTPGKITA